MRDRIFTLHRPGAGLANTGQNNYAERKGNSMPETRSSEPRIPTADLIAAAEIARRRRQGRQTVPQNRRESRVSSNETTNREAKEEVKNFAKELIEKESQRKAGIPEPASAFMPVVRSLLHESVQQLFPEVPGAPRVAQEINRLFREAGSQNLEEVATRLLVRHYVRIKTAAAESGIDEDFLAHIRSELQHEKRKVSVLRLDEEVDKAVHLRKLYAEEKMSKEDALRSISMNFEYMSLNQLAAIDMTGFMVNGPVYRFAQAINHQMQQIGIDQYNTMRYEALRDLLNSRYSDAVSLPGVVHQQEGEKDLLLQRISEKIAEVQRTLVDVRQRQEEEREEYERRPQFGWYGERQISKTDRREMKEDIERVFERVSDQGGHISSGKDIRGDRIDELFNRIFDRTNAGLREDFNHALGNTGSREREDFTAELNILAAEYADEISDPNSTQEQRDDARLKLEIIQLFIEKYDVEYSMRELLHNAFFIAETGGDFKSFADYASRFASEYGDQAFFDSPEVEIALRVREQVLYQIKRENNGRIPPELVAYNPEKGFSPWEMRSSELAKKIIRKMYGDTFPEWKIGRAISLSRGLGMALLRFPEIVAETPMPSAHETMQSQISTPWEKLVWDLNPLDHKVKRYRMGQPVRAVLYAAMKRTNKGLWNQNELREALEQESVLVLGRIGDNKRMVDMRNLTRTGGPFTHTGWRPYNAALESNRESLRPFLRKNPGLAMHMLFNRYQTADLGNIKDLFVRQTRQEHPDWDAHQVLDAWKARKTEIEALPEGDQPESEWRVKEKAFWQQAASRIPHVILRVITDPVHNDYLEMLSLQERQALLLEIEQITGASYGSTEFTEIETALTFAKENLMKRRSARLVALGDNPTEEEIAEAWTANEDKLTEDDYMVVRQVYGGQMEERVRRLTAAVERAMADDRLLDKLADAVKNAGFPFAVTAEDVPWAEYKYGQTGGRGYFTRKIVDAFTDSEANEEVIFLLKHLRDAQMQSPEAIIGQLRKIFDKAEPHDYFTASFAVKNLAIGIIRVFEKDGHLKIPIFGEITKVFNAFQHRGSSYAQTVWGGHAMAWDADDIYNFTEQLRSILDKKDIDEIRKETGGTAWQAMGKKTKSALFLLFATVFYQFTQELTEEKK